MTIYIGSGHGQDNASAGVFDSGAVGNGITEAAFVRELTPKVIAILTAAGQKVVEIPGTGNLGTRIDWLIARAKPEDWAFHVHMNSNSPSSTGTEVVYDDQRPDLADEATALATGIATAAGLKNRGIRKDTQTPRKYLGFVSRPACKAFILENGFIGNPSDVAILKAKGPAAIASAILSAIGAHPNPAPPPWQPSAEQVAAFALMTSLGVYLAATPDDPGTPKNQPRYEQAVLFSRLVGALDIRYVRS